MRTEAAAVAALVRGRVDHAVFVAVSRVVAIVAIVVVLALLSPQFLTWGNFVNVARQASLQFLGEVAAEVLVGVQHQDPVVRALAGGEIALRPETEPVLVDDARTMRLRDRHRVVVAAAVHHQLLGGERHAVQAARDVGRLVAGDHGEGQGKRGHGGDSSRIMPSARGWVMM